MEEISQPLTAFKAPWGLYEWIRIPFGLSSTPLHRYQRHGVELTPRKCEAFKNSVKYLSKIVSKEGYTIDPAELAPVQALKDRKPSTVGDQRKIPGFVFYYRPYIPNFLRIAKPLYRLLSSEKVPGKEIK